MRLNNGWWHAADGDATAIQVVDDLIVVISATDNAGPRYLRGGQTGMVRGSDIPLSNAKE